MKVCGYNLIIISIVLILCGGSANVGQCQHTGILPLPLLISPRIVGGQPTTIRKIGSYIVSLRINGKFVCGGTLVRRRYVVTAAHCVKNIAANTVTVEGGTSYLNKPGVRRNVAYITIPKVFDLKYIRMDVAVLKLSRPMRGKNIKPIAFCKKNPQDGDIIRVSGWGVTRENKSIFSNRLRTVTLKMRSKETCRNIYRGLMDITSSMICAGGNGFRDTCQGDSGGPLIFRGKFCGIVSWGYGCANKKYPGVYTLVSAVEQFIRKAIFQKSNRVKVK